MCLLMGNKVGILGSLLCRMASLFSANAFNSIIILSLLPLTHLDYYFLIIISLLIIFALVFADSASRSVFISLTTAPPHSTKLGQMSASTPIKILLLVVLPSSIPAYLCININPKFALPQPLKPLLHLISLQRGYLELLLQLTKNYPSAYL
jgi:hypothetical protein